MPKFRTNKGRLTSYALACGYIEQKSTEPSEGKFRTLDVYTELWREGNCYHVRQIDRTDGGISIRKFWESYPTLNQAQTLFNSQPGFIVNMINGIPVIGAGRRLALIENS